MNSLFTACENDESCHYVARIGSPELISFYCACFGSFYFFLFFLVFEGFYYLSSNINEVIRTVLNFLFFFMIRFHKRKKAQKSIQKH